MTGHEPRDRSAAEDASAEDASAENASAEDASAEDAPAENASAEDTPGEDASADRPPHPAGAAGVTTDGATTDGGRDDRSPPLADRAQQWLRGLRDRLPSRRASPRTQRLLLAAAAALFVVASVAAYRALPPRQEPLTWWLLGVVLLVGMPLTILVNAAEYRLSAAILQRRVPLREAVPITVLASAANVLPVPGSALVRTAALRRLGSTTGAAVSATVTVGVAWLGVTGIVAGILFVTVGTRPMTALVAGGGGTVVLAVAALAIRSQAGPGRFVSVFSRLVLVEVAATFVGGLRLFLILLALGYDVTVAQAAALVVAGVVAAASGVFPGGLGLREVLAGLISPLVGLPAALGLFATAVNRIIEYIALAPFAVLLMFRGGDRGALASLFPSARIEDTPDPDPDPDR